MQTNYQAIDNFYFLEVEFGGRYGYRSRRGEVMDSTQAIYRLLSEIEEVEAEPSC